MKNWDLEELGDGRAKTMNNDNNSINPLKVLKEKYNLDLVEDYNWCIFTGAFYPNGICQDSARMNLKFILRLIKKRNRELKIRTKINKHEVLEVLRKERLLFYLILE